MLHGNSVMKLNYKIFIRDFNISNFGYSARKGDKLSRRKTLNTADVIVISVSYDQLHALRTEIILNN
jgi:hypothetical protein